MRRTGFLHGVLVASASILFIAAGCAESSDVDQVGHGDPDASSDGDADTDTDSDTDSDSDSDADTDTDSDADSDTGEMDAGTGTDDDTESESETGGCPYDCYTLSMCSLMGGSVVAEYECESGEVCCGPAADTETETETESTTETESETESETGGDANTYAIATDTYSWVDIASSGTAVSGLGDDDYDGPFDIGFTFPFYGASKTQFYVSSNGFIAFNTNNSLTNQCPLPSTTTPNDLIALMWDDLDPSDNSEVAYYQTYSSCPTGAGQCLVVQYESFSHCCDGSTTAGTFEAILYAGGDILIQFEDAGAETGSSSTTGIENSAGTYGLSYGTCDAVGSISDNLALCFYSLGVTTGCH